MFKIISTKSYNQLQEKAQAAESLEKECEEILANNKRALIEFHNSVSHEMRVPISIILGYADLLRGKLVTDEDVRMEYMLKICDRVSYMSDLLNLLLVEARSDVEVYELVTETIDVAALVKQTALDIVPAAAQIGVKIRIAGGDTPILIKADSTRLTKAFYNILENSLKHMGRKGEISITVSNSEEGALIVFKDDGKGVKSDEIDNLFDKKYVCGQTPGQGLGLHLVKKSIVAHGGDVFAKSSPGNGLGIYICLP